MFDYISFIYDCMLKFNESVFLPLFNAFDLRNLILLLFVVYLTYRFLLMPIFGIRPFTVGRDSDTASMSKGHQKGEYRIISFKRRKVS